MEGKVVGSRQKTEVLSPAPQLLSSFRAGRPYYTPQDAPGASAGSGCPERLFIGGGGGDVPGRPAFTRDSEEWGLAGGVMQPARALCWYRRMSVVYGLGAWTLLGSLIFLSQKKSKPPGTALGQDLRRRPALRGRVRAVSGSGFAVLLPQVYSTERGGDCLELLGIMEPCRKGLLESFPPTLRSY